MGVLAPASAHANKYHFLLELKKHENKSTVLNEDIRYQNVHTYTDKYRHDIWKINLVSLEYHFFWSVPTVCLQMDSLYSRESCCIWLCAICLIVEGIH